MGLRIISLRRYFSSSVFDILITMVQIYRAEDSQNASRPGYEARYVADLVFRRALDSCGIILVDIDGSGRSSPHAHEYLEEVFIILTDIRLFINNTPYDLKEGDVVLVEPGESHSFETTSDEVGKIIAMKFPNVKDDKVVPSSESEN
jgi:quercetin dioxygenase-like cupin family protein